MICIKPHREFSLPGEKLGIFVWFATSFPEMMTEASFVPLQKQGLSEAVALPLFHMLHKFQFPFETLSSALNETNFKRYFLNIFSSLGGDVSFNLDDRDNV